MGRRRKTEKRERKVYRFSLDKERYGSLIQMLDSIPKPFRGEYIAESIRMARLSSWQSTNTEAPVEFKGVFEF